MSLPSFDDVIGGKYRVGRTIAEGGMGVVVEGFHVQLEDAVAIKFLKPDVVGPADSEVVKRFMREARTCIKIRSEHVVRVLDVDTLPSGVPYMVMERLVGRDLDAILEEAGPLASVPTVDYVLQALEAVGEAHALGIIHRDLKPANLFLATRADGSPCIKVLDFGISKIEGGVDGGMTQTQAVMGSPRYMSPEQLRASRNVDARTDVWSIGVALYELLTGRPPFDGTSMTQIAAAILEDVPAPMALRDAGSANLEAVVMRCLAKRSEHRFANVSELATALAPFGSVAATVSATRIQGILNRSGGSLPISAPLTTTVVSNPPAGPRSARDMTVAAWSDTSTRPGSHRRIGILAGVAVLFAAIGIVLLVRATAEPKAAAPPALANEPVTTLPLASATTAAPGISSAGASASTGPSASVSSSVAVLASNKPLATPPRPRPAVRPPSAPASTSAASPVSTTWSDRK